MVKRGSRSYQTWGSEDGNSALKPTNWHNVQKHIEKTNHRIDWTAELT